MPFSRDRQERLARGDSRKSLAERYKSRSRYLAELRQAALNLVEQRLMFSEDVSRVLAEGEAMYDYISRNGAWKKESESQKGSK